MNKTLLTAVLALSLTASAYANQFTNSDDDMYKADIEETESEIIEEAKDIKDTRTKEEKKAGAPIPINVSAEHADYDSVSGDFHVYGNVVLTQGVEKLVTTEAFGNMKTGDVYMEKGGTVVDKVQSFTGKWIHYNFNNKTGEIKEISGASIKDLYKSPHAIITPDKVTMDQGGWMQRCPAVKHPPCLAVKAKIFEIYPKDKLVAKDVQVFVRGKHIYSRDRWVNHFDEDKTKISPRIGYGSKTDGMYMKVGVSHPITNEITARVELPEYSKIGFKPAYKLNYYNKNFTLNYMTGWVKDDSVWYYKQNNWEFKYKPHHFIDGVPLTYSASYEYGLWRKWDAKTEKSSAKSWHKEYAVYLNHDPIHFFNSKKNSLNLTIGKKWTEESIKIDTRSTNLYYATFRQKFTDKWSAWTGYYHQKRTSSVFNLNDADMDREWRIGLQFKPDSKNTFSIVNRFDTGKGEQYETDYRWEHKFCCWRLEVILEDERKKDDHNFMIHYYFDNL